MRRLAITAIFCAALSSGAAQAQTQTGADVLAGSRWGWLGFESDLSKIPESAIQAAGETACSAPKITFSRQGDRLVKVDIVNNAPSPTTYPKTTVVEKDGKTLVVGFYAADGTKPDAVFLLSRGGSILSVADKLVGTWHYARCPRGGDSSKAAAGSGR